MRDGYDDDPPYRIVVTVADLRSCGGLSGATRFIHQVLHDRLVEDGHCLTVSFCDPDAAVGLLNLSVDGADVALTLTSLSDEGEGPRWLVYFQTRPAFPHLDASQRSRMEVLFERLVSGLADLIIVEKVASTRPNVAGPDDHSGRPARDFRH